MTRRQIGGYEFKFECNRIRQSSQAIRDSLEKILDNNLGQQTLYMLVARMAVENTTIINAIENIEKIGENHKGTRTN